MREISILFYSILYSIYYKVIYLNLLERRINMMVKMAAVLAIRANEVHRSCSNIDPQNYVYCTMRAQKCIGEASPEKLNVIHVLINNNRISA